MTTKNPEIEWAKYSGKQCLKFTFLEKLTSQEAEVAVAEWRKAFESKINTPIILIWDCRNMNGYDRDARDQWIKAIKEMKSQIDTIWLISTSGFIKTGAAVMGFFTDMEIRTVSSDSEIVV